MDNLSQIGSISLTKGLCHSFSEIISFFGLETIRLDTLDKFFPLSLTIEFSKFKRSGSELNECIAYSISYFFKNSKALVAPLSET